MVADDQTARMRILISLVPYNQQFASPDKLKNIDLNLSACSVQ